MRRTTTLLLFLFLGMNSCATSTSRMEESLKKLVEDQKTLSMQLEAISRRLTILENVGRTSGPRTQKPSRRRELHPHELPTVTLRPKQTPVPAPANSPVPDDEDDTEEDDQSANDNQDGNRVVLRLTGDPRPRHPPGMPPQHPSPGPVRDLRDAPNLPAPQKPSPRPAVTDATREVAAETLYQTAMTHFQEGRYAMALTLFARVERDFPSHNLLSNAIFWQGECHFQAGRYPLAIAQYERVISRHPKSPKFYDSMYKLGISLDKNGYPARARELLSKVVELVPQTPTATKAATYLQNMR